MGACFASPISEPENVPRPAMIDRQPVQRVIGYSLYGLPISASKSRFSRDSESPSIPMAMSVTPWHGSCSATRHLTRSNDEVSVV